jgi:DNA-binding PadR family transcriptional regulator
MFLVNALSKNRAAAELQALPMLTSIEFEILLSLAGTDRHGYAIKQDIEARSGEAGEALVMRPGTLYRAISRLLDAALIEELDEAPDPDADDERRRYYRLTARGEEAAKLEARRLARQVTAARARKLLPRQA